MAKDFFNTNEDSTKQNFKLTIADAQKLSREFENLSEKSTALKDGLRILNRELLGFRSADRIFTDLGKSVNSFFKSLAEGKPDPFRQFMKSVVSSFLTSIQAMLLGAEGAAAAKGITTFGLSLITDLPAIAGAWLALEAAKELLQDLLTGALHRQALLT